MSSVISQSNYISCKQSQHGSSIIRSHSFAPYIASTHCSDDSSILPLKMLAINILRTIESEAKKLKNVHMNLVFQDYASQSLDSSQMVKDCEAQEPLNGMKPVLCVNINKEGKDPQKLPFDVTGSASFFSNDRKFKSMKYEVNRLESFKNKWPLSFLSPDILASVGFFYMQTEDKVQCAFCKGIVVEWSPGDDPLAEHARHFPLCPFLMNMDVGNVPISGSNYSQPWLVKDACKENMTPFQCSNELSYLGSSVSHSKVAAMASLDSRIKTFSNWKNSHIVSSDVLADAGFYYTGVSDITSCFQCGGKLGNWEVGDDPWIEHSKHFPTCAFLKARQSNASVASKENVEKLMNSELAIEAAKIFTESFVREALQRQLKQNGRTFENLEDFCSAIVEVCDESKQSTKMTPASNRGTGSSAASGDRHLCKICLDQEMGVVFLPCSHLLACTKCAQSVAVCPLCRSPIESYIRAYIS